MAVERDTKDTQHSPSAEGDELNALGPDATETSASGNEDEPMDVGALAALSFAGRRAADGQAKPVQASDAPADETKLNLAAGAGLAAQASGVPADETQPNLAPAAGAGPAARAGAAPLPTPGHASSVAATPALVGARVSSSSGPPGARVTSSGRPAAATSAMTGRGWLTLLIGVALGAAVSALALNRSPSSSAGAAPERTQVASAAPQATDPTPIEAAQPNLQGTASVQPPVDHDRNAAAAALPVESQPPAAAQPALPAAASGSPSTLAVVGASAAHASAPPTAATSPGRVLQRGSTGSPARVAAVASSVVAPKVMDGQGAEHAPSGVARDSEEARLAAASVPHASQNPLDAVLDDAFADRQAHAAKALANEAAALPLAPSREDVSKAMTVLVPAMRGCAQGQSGLATAGIVVRNDGRVESVTLSGSPFAGTASGRCMEGVVRRARFPRFRQAAFRVQFPFAMQ